MMVAIIVILSSTHVIIAQTSLEDNPNVRLQLDRMFETLDKNRVPTGLLLDYAIDMVDLFEFSGELTDDNFVTVSVFEDILRTIRSSAVINVPFGNVTQIMNTFTNSISPSVINIGIAIYDFNYIKSNALDDNLLRYNSSTKKVYDVLRNGVWQNPYGQSKVVAFSPDVNFVQSSTVTYRFSPSFLFTNNQIHRVLFDAGDGLGYREIQANSSISVSYASDGDKELRLKVFTSDGQVWDTHSTMLVSDISLIAPSSFKSPNGSETFTCSHAGKTVSAEMTYYSCSSDGLIRKPFIYVEGFDPLEFASLSGIVYNKAGYTSHSSCYEKFHLKAEYDFIYIDWHNSTTDLRANAQLLRNIIFHINLMKKQSGSVERNIIFGHSMGGLIARYTLVDIEKDGIEHQVSTYISHDSPHLGANIPLGLLYFIPQFMSMMTGNPTIHDLIDEISNGLLSSGESAIYKVLHSVGVRQMLVNYVNAEGDIDNSIHESWVEELMTLGFPKGDEGNEIKNLAIVNGGQYDLYSNLVNNKYLLYADEYVKTKYLTDIIVSLLSLLLTPYRIAGLDLGTIGNAFMFPGSSSFDLDALVAPFISANAGKIISELKLTFTKKFLWLIPVKYNLFSSIKYAPSSGLFYDEFPGSFFEVNSLNIQQSDMTGWIDYSFMPELANSIMFIPTASALCIQSSNQLNSSDYKRNYYINPPIPGEETPFDSYYLHNKGKSHTHIDSLIYNWVNSHIKMSIQGPSAIISDTRYVLTNYEGDVQWSVSDDSIASIDNNGNLTIIGDGFVDIIAEYHRDGQLYRVSKNIMVNFPDLVIAKSFLTGVGYRFTACALNNAEQMKLDEMIELYDLEYEWTRLDWYGNRTTVRTKSNVYEFLPYVDVKTSISVRLVDSVGNKGTLYTIEYDQQCPYITNYRYVTVGTDGRVFFVGHNGGAGPYPILDFGVQYMCNIYNETDNINRFPYEYLKGHSCYISYSSGNGLEYFTGTPNGLYIWMFDLFESDLFLNKLDEEIEKALNGTAQYGDVVDLGLTICNSEKEPMQRLTFAIVHSD